MCKKEIRELRQDLDNDIDHMIAFINTLYELIDVFMEDMDATNDLMMRIAESHQLQLEGYSDHQSKILDKKNEIKEKIEKIKNKEIYI